MHSSGMHNALLLTVSQHALPGGCLPLVLGGSAWGVGVCLWLGVYPSIQWSRHPPPWTPVKT